MLEEDEDFDDEAEAVELFEEDFEELTEELLDEEREEVDELAELFDEDLDDEAEAVELFEEDFEELTEELLDEAREEADEEIFDDEDDFEEIELEIVLLPKEDERLLELKLPLAEEFCELLEPLLPVLPAFEEEELPAEGQVAGHSADGSQHFHPLLGQHTADFPVPQDGCAPHAFVGEDCVLAADD